MQHPAGILSADLMETFGAFLDEDAMTRLPDCRFWWVNTDDDCCDCCSEAEHRQRCEGDVDDDVDAGGGE